MLVQLLHSCLGLADLFIQTFQSPEENENDVHYFNKNLLKILFTSQTCELFLKTNNDNDFQYELSPINFSHSRKNYADFSKCYFRYFCIL